CAHDRRRRARRRSAGPGGEFDAGAAPCARTGLHLSSIERRSQHRRAARSDGGRLAGLHRSRPSDQRGADLRQRRSSLCEQGLVRAADRRAPCARGAHGCSMDRSRSRGLGSGDRRSASPGRSPDVGLRSQDQSSASREAPQLWRGGKRAEGAFRDADPGRAFSPILWRVSGASRQARR
ncbi:hypothetical protein LTR94_032037, partial [Friedmanniomyces endolithicus]